MADNYLERREREIAERRPATRRSGPSLDSLMKKNRSWRGYDTRHSVSESDLKQIAAAATLAASGMNRQRLRLRLVTGCDAAAVLQHVRMGAALKEEHLPHKGEEPGAFIVVCCTGEEDRIVDIDLGIAAENMLLKATEMGLGGLFILNFDAGAIRRTLELPLRPIAVIAIGKPAEKIFIVPVHAGADLNYYRKDGVHFVPKLAVEDLLI